MHVFETVGKDSLHTKRIGAWALPMANPEVEGVATRVPVLCPKCGQFSRGCTQLQWPDLVRRLVGSHPWQCPSCLLRFYLKRRR